MSVKKVLIVDDEDDVRLFLEDFFNERELNVVTASDGLEALEVFKAESPDVILLDIMMPKMNGIECLTEIRKISKDVKVVMITAFKDEKRMAEAELLGVLDYIIKPFSLTYLEEELIKYLE